MSVGDIDLANPDAGVLQTADWPAYGYDLDNIVRRLKTCDKFACTSPFASDPPAFGGLPAFGDGANGIDNMFASLDGFFCASGNAEWCLSPNMNASIDGGRTVLIRIDGLGTEADLGPLHAFVYRGDRTAPPSWNGSDVWAIDPASLSSQNPDSATLLFSDSYVAGNTWVSSPSADHTLELEVPLAKEFRGTTLHVSIHHVVVTMALAADRKSATGGVIAGVLSTSELGPEVIRVFHAGLGCSQSIDVLENLVSSWSDLLLDGTINPTRTCDGISIGIGFDAVAAKLGPVGAPAPADYDPCTTGDGGSDANAGAD